MTWHNKVIWSEGLFLRPQHFQQHDRYIENLIHEKCESLQTLGWGFTELTIDKNLLPLGKFALSACRGILPDGTPFNAPDDATLPTPLTLQEELHNEIVFLTLPLKRPGMADTEISHTADDLTRFTSSEVDIEDNNAGHSSTASVLLGNPKIKLMRESEDCNLFTTLGIARVMESSPDKGIILDNAYIPPCLHCAASPKIQDFMTELEGLLHHRGNALANRVSDSGHGGVSEVADFLMLQLVNRIEPLITHLSGQPRLHPEFFYRIALQIAGELATFTRREKRPAPLPPYRHNDLQGTFTPLLKDLRESLSMVLEQNAISVSLEERKYGVRVANLADTTLLKTCHFILAVSADVRVEELQSHFPAHVKIGSVEYIRQLVNSGLPGIDLHLLPVAPRQIPYHAGHSYFELDRTSRYWQGLDQSSAFAIHVAGDFPGLKMELWAIKE